MRFYAVNDRNYIQTLQNNYWGNVSQTIMDKVIVDYQSGNFNRGTVLYKPMLTVAPETAYPFATDVYITNNMDEKLDIVGAEEIKINVLFNRDMDTTIQPQVSFGPDAPYTDFMVREDNGQWISPRHYQGKINITALSGDGKQFFRVAGAVAASDKWLVTGNDSERFGFEIITSGTEAMNLQASGGENKITLSWMQDEFDLLAGYNIYRSSALDGTYEKINNTLIPSKEKTYDDKTVEPGKTYFYKFTVVKTDLTVSDFSNVSFAAAYDNLAPKIVHTPIGSATPGANLQISADITDNIKVLGARLYYRTTGTSTYLSQDMIKGENNRYIVNLPGSLMVSPGLDYYIEATDGASTVRSGRADQPNKIIINDSPKINTITPNTGTFSGSTSVTIMGSNFKSGAKVYFGGVEALNVKLINPNQITVTTPGHYPALVDVKIVNPGNNQDILLKGYTFKSIGVPLSISNTNGNIGNIIEVPIHIQEVEGLRAVDLEINYDPEVLKLKKIEKGVLTSSFTISSNEDIPGNLMISLASGLVVKGTGNIANMEFEVLSSAKLGSDIIIKQAKLNDGNISVDLIDGRFDYTQTYQISGSVNYFRGYRPISKTTLKLNGNKTFTKDTNNNGEYTLSGITTGDYKLSLSKNNQISDITAYDASLILQHAVKKINLDSNQLIAADVNQSGDINAMDASYVLEHVVGLISTPFQGSESMWKFSPNEQSINNITSNLMYQNFTGILLGDVSGNWGSGTEIQSLNDAEYSVGSGNVNAGEIISIPIEIDLKGKDIYAIEITISYDEDMLIPINVNKTDLSKDFALVSNISIPGQIKIALAGASPISSNGNIANIEFKAKDIRGLVDLIITDGKCNEDKVINITNGQINIVNNMTDKEYIAFLDAKSEIFENNKVNEVEIFHVWNIVFNDDLDQSTENKANVFIWDNTNEIFVNCKVNIIGNLLTIRPESNEYISNNNYTLYITERIKSINGKKINKFLKMGFSTK